MKSLEETLVIRDLYVDTTRFGCRSINNVVDITNYVLALFGQPLHAFDKDRLGNHVIVRNAFPGEKLTTLDEIERELVESDLVIANETEGLCLAGVMGGLTSEVENDTVNIALEAAYFDPLCVRKTSSRFTMQRLNPMQMVKHQSMVSMEVMM